MNGVIKTYMFQSVGHYLLEHYNMVFLDLDLVSCLACLLLGLYPNQLGLLDQAGKTEGVWNSIKKEMEDMGHENHFFKPYVKICFYSVIFEGGTKAMVEGIINSETKSLEMRLQEFRDSSEFNEVQAKALEISGIMNLLPIRIEFRDMSNYIKTTYDGNTFFGPTKKLKLAFPQKVKIKTSYPFLDKD